MQNDLLSILLQILLVINILSGFFIVFFQRKEPAVTWAWLMVVAFLPYFGFVIYLLLGFDSRRHIVFARKAKLDDEIQQQIANKKLLGFDYALEYQANSKTPMNKQLSFPGAEHLDDLLHLNHSLSNGSFSTNNEVMLFHEGNAKFDAMLEDIGNARYFIHLLYYIMHDDELGYRVINALAAAARRGVEVKLMVDGMGCHNTRKKFYKVLTDAGGEVTIFLPPHYIRINYRNHRKICIIDGYAGYIGGLNIGDEYVGKVKKFGFWRDTHIKITGDAAKELEVRFIMDWNFYAKNKITVDPKYFPITPRLPSIVPIQIVSSGPDTLWSSIHFSYIKMITEADRSIYIQTPYFAPDDSVFEALRIAALSGIDVRIIIPAHPDHPFVYWSSLSFLGQLLQAGVKCYQYEKGFIHSKLVMIDSLVCSTGTANMDIRSFKLNFEINAFIYDRAITKAFETQFIEDLKDCTEITQEWYHRRPRTTRIKESFSRLLSPLL